MKALLRIQLPDMLIPVMDQVLKELEKVLQEEWRKIPPETYTKLIESMPHRIEACIRIQGWPTEY